MTIVLYAIAAFAIWWAALSLRRRRRRHALAQRINEQAPQILAGALGREPLADGDALIASLGPCTSCGDLDHGVSVMTWRAGEVSLELWFRNQVCDGVYWHDGAREHGRRGD